MMAAPITEDTVLDLVGRIYDAAIDPARWPDFLEAFARAVGAHGTLIYTHNVETAQASTGADSKGINAAVNFDPEFLRSLEAHYNAVNVWAQNEEILTPGRPVTGSMLYPVRELPKTEFYNDWLRPQDAFHAFGGIIVQHGPWAMKFSALRAKRIGDYASAELRLYQQLLPHLARAATIHGRHTYLQSLSTSSLAVLDTIPVAVMLLDASARVLHTNAAGEAELRRGDPLKLHLGGALGSRSAHSSLERVIAAALNPLRSARERVHTVAQLARANGEHLSIQALPIMQGPPSNSARSALVQLIACALIVRPGSTVSPSVGPQLLSHLYGLTPAEIRVVLAIAEGQTLKRYAERRGISWHTAANQLKRAFEKTGMRRQSELVRWVHQCSAPDLIVKDNQSMRERETT